MVIGVFYAKLKRKYSIQESVKILLKRQKVVEEKNIVNNRCDRCYNVIYFFVFIMRIFID